MAMLSRPTPVPDRPNGDILLWNMNYALLVTVIAFILFAWWIEDRRVRGVRPRQNGDIRLIHMA